MINTHLPVINQELRWKTLTLFDTYEKICLFGGKNSFVSRTNVYVSKLPEINIIFFCTSAVILIFLSVIPLKDGAVSFHALYSLFLCQQNFLSPPTFFVSFLFLFASFFYKKGAHQYAERYQKHLNSNVILY